jgi:hypothetical protein
MHFLLKRKEFPPTPQELKEIMPAYKCKSPLTLVWSRCKNLPLSYLTIAQLVLRDEESPWVAKIHKM